MNIPTFSSLAVALCLASALACPAPVAPAAPAAAPQRVALERFRTGSGSFAYYSGLTDSLRVVIGTAAEWQHYWVIIHANVGTVPPPPSIDFTHATVLLAAAGRRSSGGYAIVIDSATHDAGMLRVYVRELVPGRGCVVNAVVTSPVDIARIQLRADTVAFITRVEKESCE